MPDDEHRRQRAAYRRGVLRTALVAGILMMIMGGLTLIAISQWHHAKAAQSEAKAAHRETKIKLYAPSMYLLQNEWEAGSYGRALEILDELRPPRGDEDLRGWEWRFQWQQAHGERFALRGHAGIIFGVDYSQDGSLLATAGGDRTVRLWDAQTGMLRSTLTGHTANILAVKFSPDGSLVASCGEDDTLRIWDVRSQQQKGKTMVGCYSVAFSPDGRTIATSTKDKHLSVRLWNLATQQQVKVLSQSAAVFSVAFSPDGKTLATGGNEILSKQSEKHVIRLWDVSTFSHIPHYHSLVGNTNSIYSLAFSHDGRLLAAGSEDTTARIWEVKSRRTLQILSGHKGAVSAVVFSPDDRTLATGSWDQTTRLWDIPTGKELSTLRGQPNMVTSVTFSPDGKRLATASRPEVRVWDLPKRSQNWQTSITLPSNGPLVLAPDEQTLVGRDGSSEFACWQYPSGKKLPNLSLPPNDAQGHLLQYRSCAFSPDGNLFAVAQEKEITLWDRYTRRNTVTLRGDIFSKLAFSPDSRRLATNNLANNEVSLWDVRTGRRLSQWQAYQNDVLTLEAQPKSGFMLPLCRHSETAIA